MALSNIQDIRTYDVIHRGLVKAADGVSFQVEKVEALGLAGESKRCRVMIGLGILKILPLCELVGRSEKNPTQ